MSSFFVVSEALKAIPCLTFRSEGSCDHPSCKRADEMVDSIECAHNGIEPFHALEEIAVFLRGKCCNESRRNRTCDHEGCIRKEVSYDFLEHVQRQRDAA